MPYINIEQQLSISRFRACTAPQLSRFRAYITPKLSRFRTCTVPQLSRFRVLAPYKDTRKKGRLYDASTYFRQD